MKTNPCTEISIAGWAFTSTLGRSKYHVMLNRVSSRLRQKQKMRGAMFIDVETSSLDTDNYNAKTHMDAAKDQITAAFGVPKGFISHRGE